MRRVTYVFPAAPERGRRTSMDRRWELERERFKPVLDLYAWCGWQGIKDLHAAGELPDDVWALALEAERRGMFASEQA